MKTITAPLLAILTAFVVLLAILFYIQNFSGIGPAINPPAKAPTSTTITQGDTSKAANLTGLPLNVPMGFSISYYAKNITNARDLELDSNQNLLVSQPTEGKVIAILAANQVVTVLSNLSRPHGIAFNKNTLYVAETDAVSKYDYDPQTQSAKNRTKIIDLPAGGNHWSRSLLVKDNYLYISVGSTCNVCNESDWRRAKILRSNLDGSDLTVFASGLRNSVFMTLHPKTRDIWATDMGRDFLGDNLPPDEINIISQNNNYGWPSCYGKNILDSNFTPSGRCNAATPSQVDLPAHSAPLGISFVPTSWPSKYQNKILVAFHGSWNRTVPTGYKISLVDPNTSVTEDFITGWLKAPKDSYGRPVDLLFDTKGNLFVSDDKSGSIYIVRPN